MQAEAINHPEEDAKGAKNTSVESKKPFKSQFHPRNKHQGEYDLAALVKSCPELAPFIVTNKYGNASLNFFDAEAVKTLNRALLHHYYGLRYWDIPAAYLCPPVPGRTEYIHHMADLLTGDTHLAQCKKIRCLDIGVGANCIYPIIGVKEYQWSFVGSDIDKKALQSAEKIIAANPELNAQIELRKQPNPNAFFKGVIKKNEHFHLSICNPPFHASEQEANKGTLRKLRNLKGKRPDKLSLNFGGKNNELWCNGGERTFVANMIRESQQFAQSVSWFSSLVSKEDNLPAVYKALKTVNAKQVETIKLQQGNKKSRIVAWSFIALSKQ